MKLSVKIGSAWGIPIELHLTFILLIFAVLGLAIYYNQLYTFALVVALFVFVLFHELAHSVVARQHNIKVRDIILYPMGGVSEIEEIPENPAIEWRMAIAGPLTSLVCRGCTGRRQLCVTIQNTYVSILCIDFLYWKYSA